MIEISVSDFTGIQIVEIINCINNARWDQDSDNILVAKTMADKPFETKFLTLKYDDVNNTYTLYYDNKGSSPILKITEADNSHNGIFDYCRIAFEGATTVDKPKFIENLKKFYS